MKNIYRFGFYKYWKNSWEEDYYISESDPDFINKIKDVLIKNVYIGLNNPINDTKINYINAIKACECIEDFKEVYHWNQVNIKMSFKFIELI